MSLLPSVQTRTHHCNAEDIIFNKLGKDKLKQNKRIKVIAHIIIPLNATLMYFTSWLDTYIWTLQLIANTQQQQQQRETKLER